MRHVPLTWTERHPHLGVLLCLVVLVITGLAVGKATGMAGVWVVEAMLG